MGERRRKYFNMKVEPLLNTPEMRKLQEKKLRSAVRYFYDHVPFDRKRMVDAGVTPEEIRSFEDFARAIPIARQADYRDVFKETGNDMFEAYRFLFGDQRLKDMHLLTTTSGTTGIPTPYPVFHKSAAAMGELFGRIGWRLGFGPGDRLAIGFGLSMHAAGTPHLYWFKKLKGLTILPIGAEVGTERLLSFIRLFRANILSCTPSLALHMIERGPDVLGEPVKCLNLKTLLLGAEPGAGIPEVRSRLESAYGAKVFDIGAGYGVSCEHPEYQGMHWIADDHCYYELVDPETLRPVPLEHGATGLAVFTPLEPEATIFFANMRFTINDIHQVFTEPCPCGRSGFRYKIVGRADDMLKVKGVPIYPAAIQGVINGFVPRLTGAFRIVLEVPPPRVVPPLKLKVEYGEGVPEGELPGLEKELLEKMHVLHKVRPAITWIRPHTLERAARKTQLFEKAYERK
ncbi:MAG: phenylacetate--CoA ligase family protein [bacterium]